MKRFLLCPIAALLLFPAITLAEEIKPQPFTLTTAEGVVYKNTVVQGVDPDGLRIAHSGGVAKVPFEVLDDKMLAQYHFDPDKAAAFRATRDLANAEQQDSKKKTAPSAVGEKEEAAFNLFRGRILATIQSGVYDAAKLDATLAQWIKVYSEAGKADWVALLEDDRQFLVAQEADRPDDAAAERTRQLEAENARLQEQIDLLRGAAQESQDREALGAGAESVVYDTPDGGGYFTSYSQPSVAIYSASLQNRSCSPAYISTPCLTQSRISVRSFACITPASHIGYSYGGYSSGGHYHGGYSSGGYSSGGHCYGGYSSGGYSSGGYSSGGHSHGGHSHGGGGSCRR